MGRAVNINKKCSCGLLNLFVYNKVVLDCRTAGTNTVLLLITVHGPAIRCTVCKWHNTQQQCALLCGPPCAFIQTTLYCNKVVFLCCLPCVMSDGTEGILFDVRLDGTQTTPRAAKGLTVAPLTRN